MYIHYPWVREYLQEAPSVEEAARLLNLTGLETEVDGEGLEIEYTVNRPDAMCHFGIARELSVKLGTSVSEPETYTEPISRLEGWVIRSEEPEHCDRYMGLYVENVAATPSPQWLKDKLEAIDQTSHNLLVDLTNFLLWEFAHPSHAFDSGKIEGQEIIIRFGGKGETLTTLDGRDHTAENFLCIADAARPIAFGGVMGGQNSEVDEKTQNLLLELACFKPSTVRTTGRRCNIESDARHRFERGVDREKMDRVIRRFIFLLRREQPDCRIIGLLDMDLNPFERAAIHLRRRKLDGLLGVHLDDEVVWDLLQRMDCRPEKTGEGWQVTVPGYKVDVTREADVIEEIIRFAGLDTLESTLPTLGGSDLEENPIYMGETSIRELLRGAGWQETCTYGFLSEDYYRRFETEHEPVRLRNPMTQTQAVMRAHILPNMLDCVRNNINRGILAQNMFEIGHTFRGVDDEPHHLAMALVLGKESENWWKTQNEHPFYHIKGGFEFLADTLGWGMLAFSEEVPPWLQSGQALAVHFEGKAIGGFGMLAGNLAASWDLEVPVAVLELDLSFLAAAGRIMPDVAVLSQFPGMKFDMAFVLDKIHKYEDILTHLNGLDLPDLEQLSLFDVYEGKAIESGKRSLGFRFKFQAADRTLTSDEVNQCMEQVTQTMQEHFGAVIRM